MPAETRQVGDVNVGLVWVEGVSSVRRQISHWMMATRTGSNCLEAYSIQEKKAQSKCCTCNLRLQGRHQARGPATVMNKEVIDGSGPGTCTSYGRHAWPVPGEHSGVGVCEYISINRTIDCHWGGGGVGQSKGALVEMTESARRRMGGSHHQSDITNTVSQTQSDQLSFTDNQVSSAFLINSQATFNAKGATTAKY
ncbi:hypothetical protein CBL_04443 [Carabus blaptoides fortunei]